MESSTSTPSSDAETSMFNPLFFDDDADVTFKSSDGILFKIHSKHLASTSAGFALPAESTYIGEEPVILSEHSDVLDILFQFIHPPTEAQKFRQPSVMNLEIKLFFELAEAAEKYIVFGAMTTCQNRMEQLYESYPIKVLNHCSKHDYDLLADKAAPFTISMSIEEVIERLTFPGVATRWMKYYGKWLEVPKFANSLIQQDGSADCKRMLDALNTLCRSMILESRYIRPSDRVNTSLRCPYGKCICDDIESRWINKIDKKVQNMPLFSQSLDDGAVRVVAGTEILSQRLSA